MRAFIFLISVLFISACTELPERTSISEKLNEISNQIEQEIADQCGNSIVDKNEQCDFEGFRSCSSIDVDLIGPMWCLNCQIISQCIDQQLCDSGMCNGNGTCVEDEITKQVSCKCYENYSSSYCNECSPGAHIDLDGTCISDDTCTVAGCENEHSECKVVEEKAVCQCIYPWEGDECDQCRETYELVDGECVGTTCFNLDIKCPEHERCDDSTGTPVCVCEYENQNPENCSECLPGYDWVQDQVTLNYRCLNRKTVNCITDPEAPELSKDIIKTYQISYTEENGWETPPYCSWECQPNTYEIDGICYAIFRYRIDENLFPIGIDNDNIVAGSLVDKKIVFIGKNKVEKTINTEFNLSDARFLPDGNIVFRTEDHLGIMDPETGNYIIFDHSTSLESPMSVSVNGTVLMGDTVFSFPDISSIYKSTSDATSILSYTGDILTVFVDGDVVLSDRFRNNIWNKKFFSDYSPSKYAAFDGNGNAYLPYNMGNSMGILKIKVNTGEALDSIDLSSMSSSHFYKPAVSSGADGVKFIVSNGVLSIYDALDKYIGGTSDLLEEKYNALGIPPIITDKGLVFFTSYNTVICYRVFKNKIITFNLDSNPLYMLYHNNMIAVFTNAKNTYILNALGDLSGKWPHSFHDPSLSNSMEEKYDISKPKAAVPVLPEENHSQYPGNVIFTWDIPDDPDASYTLLIRGPSGYDKVYAGPEKNLDSYSVQLDAGKYLWHIVARNKDGAITISDEQNFEIKSE